jgi:hypothetical protein
MSEETDYWRVQAQDAVTELHAAEARMADVMRAGDLEHARMAAMIEACEAVAQFVESYDRDSTVARLLPTFYANLRVYGKNARAAVSACRAQADAIVGELAAGRAATAALATIGAILEGEERGEVSQHVGWSQIRIVVSDALARQARESQS